MSKIIGFIGLGIMGLPQACNLVKAGYEVIGYNRSKAKIDKFVENGGKATDSIAEVAQKSDIIFTMLPNGPDVKEVVLGENGILNNAKAGTIYIDMSSISPVVSQEVAAELAKKGVKMLDAPVSGGEPKAIDGTLSVMVGGEQSVFDEALEYIKPMAASVVRVGDIGAGNVCKLANQIVVALNIASVSEALAFAAKAGADPELVFEAIKGGLAGSTVMNAKAPMMLENNTKAGFFLKYHMKDLNNVADAAKKINMPTSLTAMVTEIMQACLADGYGDSDHSSIAKYFEKIGNVKISK